MSGVRKNRVAGVRHKLGVRENIVKTKNYLDKECIRMLNGLEKTLEQKIPERERRWQVSEELTVFGSSV